MKTWLVVLKELWYFVTIEWFGLRPQLPMQLTLPAGVLEPLPVTNQRAQTQAESAETPDNVTQTAAQTTSVAPIGLEEGESVFVTIPETPLSVFPTLSADGVLERLPYGTPLMVLERTGAWLKVRHREQLGYVRDDMVVIESTMIEPQLRTGVAYHAADPETIKLRTIIHDEFAMVAGDYPLHDIEVVSYRLLRDRRLIPWPIERPRIAGRWQQLLKGRRGVHIGIMPKTGCVMERTFADGTGQVGYVYAVAPDRSIKFCTVATDGAGRYEEKTAPAAQWREWAPVFISIA